MKKSLLFILMTAVFGIVSCNHSSNNNQGASDIAAAEVITIENGQLSFYDLQKQSAIVYQAETDSVISFTCDFDNHLYYTVAKKQDLWLKVLDLNVKDPQPKICTNWHLTIDDITDFMMGDHSGIIMDADQTKVMITHHANTQDEYLSRVRCCELATGKTFEMSNEDYFGQIDARRDRHGERFMSNQHAFYHINSDGSKTSLSDKINFNDFFEAEEVADLEYDVFGVDPTGKKVIFETAVFWGEGWGYYCLANLDGSGQQVIKDSDIWQQVPEWLEDGSLVYVGQEPRPQDDPEYEEWNTSKPCVKLMLANGTVTTIGHGDSFLVKPFGPKPNPEEKASITNSEGCDLVMLNQGKLILYNSSTNQFIPFDMEKDSVVNAAFMYEDDLYYTVCIGGELYLKNIYFSNYNTEPRFVTDWGLRLEQCISETYGEMAPLMSYKNQSKVGMPFDFNWEFYSFADIRFYEPGTMNVWDGWSEEEETDSLDEEFRKWEEDYSKFTTEDNNFYYTNNGSKVCVSDKIDFKKYVSDISYFEDPSFDMRSISPSNKSVCYLAIIEYGDLGHGPLCFATLDGKVQLALGDTDAATLTAGWLNDGSLVYVGDGSSVKRVTPDGKVSVLSNANSLVTLH